MASPMNRKTQPNGRIRDRHLAMELGVTHLACNRDQERGIKKANLGRKRGEEDTYRLISGEQRVRTLETIEQDNLCSGCSNDSYNRRGRCRIFAGYQTREGKQLHRIANQGGVEEVQR